MTIFNKITWRIFHFVFLSPFYTLFLLLSPTDNTSKAYSTNPLWNRAALLYITLLWVQLPVHIICVHVWMSMQWIEYRWWSSKGSYPSISNPRSIRLLLSSLHYLLPLFLLTYAVRGDINLSDRLCDPPPGLGGRRSAVNINILPGFRQTWSIRGHHESSAMITGGKHRHHPKMPPWALYPSTKCTIDTVSLMLVLDCRTIFSPHCTGW